MNLLENRFKNQSAQLNQCPPLMSQRRTRAWVQVRISDLYSSCQATSIHLYLSSLFVSEIDPKSTISHNIFFSVVDYWVREFYLTDQVGVHMNKILIFFKQLRVLMIICVGFDYSRLCDQNG